MQTMMVTFITLVAFAANSVLCRWALMDTCTATHVRRRHFDLAHLIRSFAFHTHSLLRQEILRESLSHTLHVGANHSSYSLLLFSYTAMTHQSAAAPFLSNLSLRHSMTL